MSTQFQINVFSLSPMFLYTGQLEHVLYHHCEVDNIAAHPQHNHHSLRNSSNSAVYQPQVADAGRSAAAARPAVQQHTVRISGGRTLAQPAAIFSMLCWVVAHRN